MTDLASAHYHDVIQAWLDQVPRRQMALAWLCRQDVVAYLVGGTVRDALLGKAGNDMDLAIDGDALAVGRGLADALHGAYVPLDVAHNVCRVVVKTPQGSQHLDLAGLRGEGIEADLCARDLTVNAMAILVSPEWGALLDPTGGKRDLGQRLLRVTGPAAFVDDPVRMLRTVRLRAKLGFEIEATTEALLHGHAASLRAVSAERVRDELILILEHDHAAATLDYVKDQGFLTEAVPHLAAAMTFPHDGLARLLQFERWLVALRSAGPAQASWLPTALKHYGQQLLSLWAHELSSERSRQSLLKLAVLMSALPKASDAASDLAHGLRLSSIEDRYLQAAVAGMARTGGKLGNLDIYHHYRHRGDAGLDAAVVALAAAPGDEQISACVWQLLIAWFEQHAELIDPPRLLTGREVMIQGGLAPGPRIGALLESMREAQVLGQISNRVEALAWLRHAVADL